MYSLLLMTAVAAGPDTSSFGWKSAACYGSCYGACYGSYSYGCCGGYSYGCCGGYSYGCCGGYSYGCCGGYNSCCGGFGGGLFAKHHAHKAMKYACYGGSCCGGYSYSCGGCCGGVYYSSCNGCSGSCYGTSCNGSFVSPAYGCVGVVTGPAYVGPTMDVYPGLATTPAVVGTPSTAAPAAPSLSIPPIPGTGSNTADAPASPTSKSEDVAADLVRTSGYAPAKAAPARLTLELPAKAKLFVDGEPTRGSGSVRQFHTPALPAGQAFYYEFRAEFEVDGKTEVEEKKVVVRAGEALTEAFPKLIAAAKGEKPAVVAAK